MKKSRKKLVLRVLFVLLSAALLTGVSVLLGTYLGKKAESSQPVDIVADTTAAETAEPTELYPDGIPSGSEASSLKVCAADIDITVGTPQSIYDRITALSDTYNAVSVRISGEDGLCYVSPALLAYVGVSSELISYGVSDLPETEAEDVLEDGEDAEETEEGKEVILGSADNVFENLTAVAAGAKAAGLRLSAVFTASPDILDGSDAAIAEIAKEKVIFGELLSLGFDELILDGLALEDEELSHDKLRSMITYLAKLREATGELDIGVTLPASVYLIPQTASKIKTLSEYADFLAIGITSEADDPEEAYSLVYESCYSLKGNFSVYNIRGVIEEEDPEVAAAIFASLTDMSVGSVQFTVYNSAPSYTPDAVGSEVPADTEGYAVNENASRAEDYAVGASDGEDEE